MTGFIRRTFYERSAPPAADAIMIGESEIFLPLTEWPDLDEWPEGDTWDAFAVAALGLLTAAADAGEGFAPGIGEGDADWDTEADAPITSFTALLGVLRATWQQVTPNPSSGALTSASGARYDLSATPTDRILLTAAYAATVEPDAYIREVGIFLNPTPASGHGAQSYLPIADLADYGQLLGADRILMVQRNDELSGAVKVVLRIGEA